MKIGRPYIIQFFGVLVVMLSALSCAKQRSLSDQELAMVFRDAFLSNAYSTDNKLKLDSLKLYEPIFRKYGYTTEDVQYTIGSFATRKSARLSDVVERSIAMLESVGQDLDYQVAVLDTIDKIVTRRAVRSVYEEPLIELRSIRDTSKFNFVFEDLEPGNYEIRFTYLIGEDDTTVDQYRTMNWMEDTTQEPKSNGKVDRIKQRQANLVRNAVTTHLSVFTVADTNQRAVVKLLSKPSIYGTPYVKIKDFTLRSRPTTEWARDSIFRELFNVRIFDDELLFTKEKAKDSL